MELLSNLPTWVMPLIVTTLVSTGVGVFARMVPKRKMMGWVMPKAYGFGQFISKILVVRLGRKAAERLEEGVIVTLLSVLYAAVDSFGKGLLSDNDSRKGDNK